jgi:hypothetical protein
LEIIKIASEEVLMVSLLGPLFRKLSMVVAVVGLLACFYTEAFADVPIGRRGRPNPPIAVQRLSYMGVNIASLPGTAWAVMRTVRGQQKSLCE